MPMIDWGNSESHILINPKASLADQTCIKQGLGGIDLLGHCWVGTSGTTGRSKWIALSKEAILSSAKAVNAHLQSDASDIWLHALPDFHVGGIGIAARSFLSGAKIVYYRERWDAAAFHALASQANVTLSALVPTQLYDLVEKKIQAPPSLRAVVIGGGALSPSLYFQARELGWRPLPSYGMTECASQVATASLDSLEKESYPTLKCLSHVEVSRNAVGCFRIGSAALFTMIATFDDQGIVTTLPRAPGSAFDTEDCGEVIDNHLIITGRVDDVIKVSGERVDMNRLNQLLDELRMGCPFDATLSVVSDPRLGNAVVLVVASPPSSAVDALVAKYNGRVLPFERIRHLRHLDTIPRTPLGKVIRAG